VQAVAKLIHFLMTDPDGYKVEVLQRAGHYE